MGKSIFTSIFGLGMLLVAASVSGCASPGSERQARAEREADQRFAMGPLVDGQGSHRSLSVDSRAMQDLQFYQPWLASGPNWYDTRNDDLRSVTSGTRRLSISVSQTITRDRLYSSHGRVYDNYSQNTIREKFIQVVR